MCVWPRVSLSSRRAPGAVHLNYLPCIYQVGHPAVDNALDELTNDASTAWLGLARHQRFIKEPHLVTPNPTELPLKRVDT